MAGNRDRAVERNESDEADHEKRKDLLPAKRRRRRIAFAAEPQPAEREHKRRQQRHARQLDRNGDLACRRVDLKRGGDDLRHFMDGRAGPERISAKIEMEHAVQQRIDDHPDRSHQTNGGDRIANVLVAGFGHRVGRDDRGRAAYGRAGGDQLGKAMFDAQHTAEPFGEQKGRDENRKDHEQGDRAQIGKLVKGELQSEQAHGETQQVFAANLFPGAMTGRLPLSAETVMPTTKATTIGLIAAMPGMKRMLNAVAAMAAQNARPGM